MLVYFLPSVFFKLFLSLFTWGQLKQKVCCWPFDQARNAFLLLGCYNNQFIPITPLGSSIWMKEGKFVVENKRLFLHSYYSAKKWVTCSSIIIFFLSTGYFLPLIKHKLFQRKERKREEEGKERNDKYFFWHQG